MFASFSSFVGSVVATGKSAASSVVATGKSAASSVVATGKSAASSVIATGKAAATIASSYVSPYVPPIIMSTITPIVAPIMSMVTPLVVPLMTKFSAIVTPTGGFSSFSSSASTSMYRRKYSKLNPTLIKKAITGNSVIPENNFFEGYGYNERKWEVIEGSGGYTFALPDQIKDARHTWANKDKQCHLTRKYLEQTDSYGVPIKVISNNGFKDIETVIFHEPTSITATGGKYTIGTRTYDYSFRFYDI